MTIDINKLSKEEILTLKQADKEGLLRAKQESFGTSNVLQTKVGIKDTNPLVKTLSSVDTNGTLKYIDVTMVASVANFVHYNGDMLLPSTYDKALQAGNKIAHLQDHNQTIAGVVGEVQKVYTKQMQLQDLGGTMPLQVTALLMDSRVKQSFNDKVFIMYSENAINQHSIGYSYNDFQLAVNEPTNKDFTTEYALWKQYYPDVINKPTVDKMGYFWVVTDINLKENSAVLFGANPYTPTLSEVGLPVEHAIAQQAGNIANVVNLSTQPIGNPMTSEEQLAKIIELQTQVDSLKSSQELSVATAAASERDRILKTIEAKTTFGISEGAMLDAIKQGYDLKVVTTLFTSIKAGIDAAAHIDTTGSTNTGSLSAEQLAALQSQEAGNATSFADQTMKGLEAMGKKPQLFAGVR